MTCDLNAVGYDANNQLTCEYHFQLLFAGLSAQHQTLKEVDFDESTYDKSFTDRKIW